MAGVVATVTETEYAGHCEDAVRDLDMSKVDLVISVSGDGMLHELVNGIMKRDDWHQATKVPVGVIPCGTGNALAATLMYPLPIISILTLIKRQWRPFDLMAAYQYTPPAIPSTIDINTTSGDSTSTPAPKLSSQKRSSSKLSQAKLAPTAESSNDADIPAELGEGDNSARKQESATLRKSDSKRKSKKAKESETASEAAPSSADASSAPSASTDAPSAQPSESSKSTPKSHKKAKSNLSSGTSSQAASSAPSTPINSPSGSRLQTKAAIARQARQASKGLPTPGTWNLICYSFEALMWGIISDVDIETEPWRWMGDFRFTLGAVRRVAAMRHYPARLLTLDSSDVGDHMATCQFHSVCTSCSDGHHEHYNRHERLEKHFAVNETTIEKTIIHERVVLDGDHVLSDEKVVAVATETEEVVEKAPRRKKKKVVESAESPDATSDLPVESAQSTETVTATTTEEEPLTTKGKKDKSKSKSELIAEPESSAPSDETKHKRKKSKKKEKELEEVDEIPAGMEHADKSASPAVASNGSTPTRNAPVTMKGLAKGLDTIIDFDPMQPNAEFDTTRWHDLTTRFVYFVASNISHIGTDLRVAPFSHTCGGTVDVIYAEEVPKLSMLDLLTSMENGRYIGHSSVTYKKVKAFVLIPTGKPGVIDLDGEEYEPLPTAIEVHTGVLRMCFAIWNLSLPEEDL